MLERDSGHTLQGSLEQEAWTLKILGLLLGRSQEVNKPLVWLFLLMNYHLHHPNHQNITTIDYLR